MATSFGQPSDKEILEHIRAIKAIGADVVVQTTEHNRPSNETTRVVTITWQTHNTDGRLLD